MSKKKWLLGAVILSIFTYQNVQAVVLHWPQLCAAGELQLKNDSADSVTVWLQKFGKTLIRETEITIDPKSILILPLAEITEEERFALLAFNDHQPQLVAKHKCADQVQQTSSLASSLEGGVLTYKKSDLLTNKIWIQNLFTGSNQVEIEFQDSAFKKIITEKLTLTSLARLVFTPPDAIKNWSYFRFTTSHKSAVFNLSSTGHDQPIKITPPQSTVDPAAFYFLVGSRQVETGQVGLDDSFVVKITDENLAARARELIANPQQEKMLFARIQKDHQGFNRNWSKIEKSFWSWSTAEVTNFADLGSTACNGTPQEVEDRMDYWVTDPGQICFWNYRVKKELSAQQVATGL